MAGWMVQVDETLYLVNVSDRADAIGTVAKGLSTSKSTVIAKKPVSQSDLDNLGVEPGGYAPMPID